MYQWLQTKNSLQSGFSCHPSSKGADLQQIKFNVDEPNIKFHLLVQSHKHKCKINGSKSREDSESDLGIAANHSQAEPQNLQSAC